MVTIQRGQEIEVGDEELQTNWLGFTKYEDKLVITKVRVREIEDHGDFKLFVTDTLDGMFHHTYSTANLRRAMKLANRDLFVTQLEEAQI